MHHSRPKNLNLFTIRFPIPAIVSIFHRLSGIALFLIIPLALWGLSTSLTDSGFDMLQHKLDNGFVKGLIWLLLVPFCYHFAAGIRHLLMDIHVGDSLKTGRLTAGLTIVISIVLMILAGIWLW